MGYGKERPCKRCFEEKLIQARGLCQSCFSEVKKQGTLDDYPAKKMKDQKNENPSQKAILTFTDNPDGTLNVSMEFEPAVTDETRSGAVTCALRCLEYLEGSIGSLGPSRK